MVSNILRKTWRVIGRFRYVIVIVVALSIIAFIDSNSFIERVKHKERISELKAEIKQYNDAYTRDSLMIKRMGTHPEIVERIARERYLMKADDEDIFILEEE